MTSRSVVARMSCIIAAVVATRQVHFGQGRMQVSQYPRADLSVILLRKSVSNLTRLGEKLAVTVVDAGIQVHRVDIS